MLRSCSLNIHPTLIEVKGDVCLKTLRGRGAED